MAKISAAHRARSLLPRLNFSHRIQHPGLRTTPRACYNRNNRSARYQKGRRAGFLLPTFSTHEKIRYNNTHAPRAPLTFNTCPSGAALHIPNSTGETPTPTKGTYSRLRRPPSTMKRSTCDEKSKPPPTHPRSRLASIATTITTRYKKKTFRQTRKQNARNINLFAHTHTPAKGTPTRTAGKPLCTQTFLEKHPNSPRKAKRPIKATTPHRPFEMKAKQSSHKRKAGLMHKPQRPLCTASLSRQ